MQKLELHFIDTFFKLHSVSRVKFFFEHLVSQLVGILARVPIPEFMRVLIFSPFIWVTGIRIQEAEKPLTKYRSLDDLFTRKLRLSLRPIHSEDWICPCDGRILDFGTVADDHTICVKNQPILISEFYPKFAARQFLVIYLSPQDCHQIMMPTNGLIDSIRFFSGGLSTVRPGYVVRHPEILFKNARLNFNIDSEAGRATMVMVGALNVSSVSTPFCARQRLPRVSKSDEIGVRQEVSKGTPVGTFHLGSTIVLLFENPINLRSVFKPGYRVELGEPLV